MRNCAFMFMIVAGITMTGIALLDVAAYTRFMLSLLAG